MRYIFATYNEGKAREIKALFHEAGLSVISLADTEHAFVPAETGTTFVANAIQKATETAAFLRDAGEMDVAVLSDDSGLDIDALDGLLGVDTALFMGDAPQVEKNKNILARMEGVDTRTAKYTCVIACVLPNGKILTTEGHCVGEISREMFGEGGFGYDPIFFLPEYGKTVAQLSDAEKNKISHRGKALRAMMEKLV